MSASRLFLTVVTAMAMMAVVGCQSSSSTPSAAMEPPGRAVVVSGNTGSYTVFIPSADKMHADVLASSGTTVCPECKAAAEHYFLTGELIPKCKTTGCTRTAVMYVTPSVSHN
jgi:hypothetical protein